jgi:hypothetical protein
MNDFLIGAFAMGCFMASMAFWRFFRTTGDRLFVWFSLSFAIECINRIGFVASGSPDDAGYYYGARLLSYFLFLWAILEKNWPRASSRGAGHEAVDDSHDAS